MFLKKKKKKMPKPVRIGVTISSMILAVFIFTNPKANIFDLLDDPYDFVEWFDFKNSSEQPGDEIFESAHTAFSDMTFRCEGETMEAITPEGDQLLYGGSPIWDAFFLDLTGDEIPELCSTTGKGIEVYDYAGQKLYELANDQDCEYSLELHIDTLYVRKKSLDTDDLRVVGKLSITGQGELTIK